MSLRILFCAPFSIFRTLYFPHKQTKWLHPNGNPLVYCAGLVQEPARQMPPAGQAAAVHPGLREVSPPQGDQGQVSAAGPGRRRLLLLALRVAALRHPGVAL